MEDIPQPAPEPYSRGEKVRIYLGDDDIDGQYHGKVCEVTEILVDNLDSETGRPLDAYSYTVREAVSDNDVPVSFRHHDLVPVYDDYDE